MAFYVFECRKKTRHVDTSLLCVDIDINIPNPTSIVRIAVPP